MSKDRNDAVYFLDMLNAVGEAIAFCRDMSLEHFVEDRRTFRAVERCLEILGEAARQVSEDGRKRYPGIPWKAVIGQRNVLAHGYAEIRAERILLVVQKRLPELVEVLRGILAGISPKDA
jgi:uncharacterized protein with HEPN domain